MKRIMVSIEEARILRQSLDRAVAEAIDHETTQAACVPEIGLSIHVNPHKDQEHDCKGQLVLFG